LKQLKERKGSYFFTEIRACLATFFAMAYLISVNANITTQSGGTCVCPSDGPDLCDTDPAYSIGVQEINRDLVPATTAIAALTSFCMGLFANMRAQQHPATPQDKANSNPAIALARGMRLNAYFAYTVVGYHGSGPVPYGVALTAVFVEGFVFVALTLLRIRQWLVRTIPASIKLATGVGIGLYLIIMGLTYSTGIGAITGQASTPVELAGCASVPMLRR
jgi:AGZA family xanthine/uracil permease-like MFS transporter